MKFKIDTGADISIIPIKTYKNLREKPILKPVNDSFTSPGRIVRCIGKFNTVTEEGKDKYYLEIYGIE